MAPSSRSDPRRRYRRLACQWPALGSAGQSPLESRLINIGLGGCAIVSRAPAPTVGNSVQLLLTLPAPSDSLAVSGHVAWVDGTRAFGVTFDHLNHEPHQQLVVALILSGLDDPEQLAELTGEPPTTDCTDR